MTTNPEHRLPTDESLSAWCDDIAEHATQHGIYIATAESLTAGNLAAMLGKSPSAGDWYRGGIVAYHKDVKHSLLEVPQGPVVCEDAAVAMARSAARLLGAQLAIAITGEAGPETQEDQPPGTVWIAVYDRGEITTDRQNFGGEPEAVLAQTLSFSIACLRQHVKKRST
ncbi:CinA family protein [Rhodococcus sovatensis]|uniref:CinA family protein n=1 Tax=Rhodococcus sovatensis TaxID=1805840 RepID=A0ABZ2PM77_9NOCA